jgi:proline racemase
MGTHGDGDRLPRGGEKNNVIAGGGLPLVPTIAGQAWLTGVFRHGFDPTDPFRGGYTLPDLW